MQDQIKGWAAKFGVQPQQVETGIGAVLGFIKAKVPAAQFQQLQGLMPMAQQWIQKAGALPAAGAQPAGGGGLLGMATGMLGKLGGGGEAGGLGQVLGQLQSAGFKPETAMQFVPTVLTQLKSMAGPEKFDQIVGSVPALKGALGGGGASALLGKLMGGGKP